MTQTSTNLRFGHLNVYHLSGKLHDIKYFFENTQITVFGMSETRLKTHTPMNHLSIPNYSIQRKDPTPSNPLHTGLVVYVHESVSAHTRRRTDLESEEVESLWIELNFKKERYLIGNVYRNPASRSEWYDAFVSMMDNVQKNKCSIILMGDFNIDFLQKQPTWESTTALFGLRQLIKTPTRVTPTSQTLIDHIYTNNPDTISDVDVPVLGISDHYPVCCTVACKNALSPNCTKHSSIVYRCFKHFNEQAFQMDLSLSSFNYVYNFNEPDPALTYFTETFLRIANKHAPLREKRVKQRLLPPWFTSDIRKAMITRDTLKKQKKIEDFKRERNRVNNLVRQAKRNYFQKIASTQDDISAVWRAVNTLTGKKNSPKQNLPSQLTPDVLNDFFVSVASKTLDQTGCRSIDENNYEIPTVLRTFCNHRNPNRKTFSVPYLSVYETGKLISKLNSRKSVGLDTVSVQLLKLALPYIVEPLTYIYNLCIQHNSFPTNFKKAKVIPIPKTKSMSTSPSDYRPISILSILSKPLERHIHKHMLSFYEQNSLFHSYQSGFREYHSCQTALTRLTDTWLTALNKREMVGAVFLDLSKAFDLVNHNILMKKLAAYNINQTTLTLIRSYLTGRNQCVQINGMLSGEKPILCGVPQGSILGPLLFCIFINDLPLCISSSSVQCDMFADDDTLHASGKNVHDIRYELQTSVNDVSKWCDMNLMALNPSKSNCMLIATRQKHQKQLPTLDLNLNSKGIKQVSEHRLLGITIDDQMKWQVHIETVGKKIARNIYLLSKIRDIANYEAKRTFFFAHIMSHLSYVSNVWDGSAEVHMKILYSLHRRAIKMLPCRVSPKSEISYENLGILPLSKQLLYNKSVLVFRTLCGKSPAYLLDFLTQSERSDSNRRLLLPKPRIDLYKMSFAFSGSTVWNDLPDYIKASRSLPQFKRSSFKYYLSLS